MNPDNSIDSEGDKTQDELEIESKVEYKNNLASGGFKNAQQSISPLSIPESNELNEKEKSINIGSVALKYTSSPLVRGVYFSKKMINIFYKIIPPYPLLNNERKFFLSVRNFLEPSYRAKYIWQTDTEYVYKLFQWLEKESIIR